MYVPDSGALGVSLLLHPEQMDVKWIAYQEKAKKIDSLVHLYEYLGHKSPSNCLAKWMKSYFGYCQLDEKGWQRSLCKIRKEATNCSGLTAIFNVTAVKFNERAEPSHHVPLITSTEKECVKMPDTSLGRALTAIYHKNDTKTSQLQELEKWTKSQSLNGLEKKAAANFLKAVVESGWGEEAGNLDLNFKEPLKDVTIEVSSKEAQGHPKYMEDRHFSFSCDEYFLAGVFDGHRGPDVAQYCNTHIPKYFRGAWKNIQDPIVIFKQINESIHAMIDIKPKLKKQGTTALLLCIPKNSGRVYTMALGDSLAKAYVESGDRVISLPLSPLRKPDSEKDRARYLAHGKDFQVDSYKTARNPKGLSVSRSYGNVDYDPYIYRKPKISMAPLQKGVIVLATDGVWDYRVPFARLFDIGEKAIEEAFIEDSIAPHFHDENLAEKIIDHSIDGHTSRDNVTAITIKIS